MGDKIRPAFARSIPVTSCHGERSRPSARRLFAGCAEPLSVGIRAAVRRLRIDDPFGWPVTSAQPVEFGSWPGWYAGVIELVAGLLIATGLFTRAVAFVASGEMAVAYFWMHQPYALWPIGGPPDGAELRRYCSASASSCWCSPVVGSTQLMLDALSLHKAGQATQASIVAGRQGTSL